MTLHVVVTLIKTRQSDNERQPTYQDKENERQVMFLCSKVHYLKRTKSKPCLASLRSRVRFESEQSANRKQLRCVQLFANQSGPRADLEWLSCVLLFASQTGPSANLEPLECVLLFANQTGLRD